MIDCSTSGIQANILCASLFLISYYIKVKLEKYLFQNLYLLKIERWWRELHHHLEKFFKRQLRMLQEQGHYDSNNETDR